MNTFPHDGIDSVVMIDAAAPRVRAGKGESSLMSGFRYVCLFVVYVVLCRFFSACLFRFQCLYFIHHFLFTFKILFICAL